MWFPGLAPIWKSILNAPVDTPFSHQALLSIKSSKRALTSRIPPELETQIMFVLKNVKLGGQARYQAWMARKYVVPVCPIECYDHFLHVACRFFSDRHSDSLIVDCVRYICCCFHPSNKLLQSPVTPRWAFLGWILSQRCVCSHIAKKLSVYSFCPPLLLAANHSKLRMQAVWRSCLIA